jgi:hypothetical protein
MKKTLFAAAVALFAGNLCANAPVDAKQAAPAPAQAQVQTPAKVETKAAEATKNQVAQNDQSMMQNNQQMMSGNCENMTMEEKNFANQLNASNKTMFCNQFSAAQRKNAMQMMGTTGANGMKMSADMAVEQTAKGMTPGATAPKSAGGCPVR